jgi:hypothetical protein
MSLSLLCRARVSFGPIALDTAIFGMEVSFAPPGSVRSECFPFKTAPERHVTK